MRVPVLSLPDVSTQREIKRESDALLTVAEVAGMLSMSPAYVRQHSNGRRLPQIPSVKLGKCRRFRRPDVMDFIKDSMESASQ